MKIKTSVWIYFNKGELPHMVRIVKGEQVTEIPCDHTPVDKIKSLMNELYGRCEFSYVEISDIPQED